MNVVWREALASQGVLSSEAIRELNPCVLPGWDTGFGPEEGNLLAGAPEQWP